MPPWPECANRADQCPWPGVLLIKFEDGEGGFLQAHVCPLCVVKVKELLKEMAAVRSQDALRIAAEHDGGETGT